MGVLALETHVHKFGDKASEGAMKVFWLLSSHIDNISLESLTPPLIETAMLLCQSFWRLTMTVGDLSVHKMLKELKRSFSFC